jgi:hypothetical protein
MRVILVSLPGPTNNAPVFRALEYGVIILLWLFFMWVVRAVWVEVRPLKRPRRRGAEVDPVVDGKRRRRRELRLHVIRPEDQAGRTYEVGDEVTVGRAPGCGVPIDYDSYSSNLHARLFRLDQWHLGQHRADRRENSAREGRSSPGRRHRLRSGEVR